MLHQESVEKIYYRMHEISQIISTSHSCIRYWLREFGLDQKIKRGRQHANERLFRKEDVELVKEIHRLLAVEMFTIKGAKRQLIAQGFIRP